MNHLAKAKFHLNRAWLTGQVHITEIADVVRALDELENFTGGSAPRQTPLGKHSGTDEHPPVETHATHVLGQRD